MFNVGAFAIMVALGLYYEVSWSYFVLLATGSLLSVVAGFASFSRGSWFAQGRSEAVTSLCMLAAWAGAIAIGWLNGFWWGLASAVLFWPVMYRLGVHVLIGLPEPTSVPDVEPQFPVVKDYEEPRNTPREFDSSDVSQLEPAKFAATTKLTRAAILSHDIDSFEDYVFYIADVVGAKEACEISDYIESAWTMLGQRPEFSYIDAAGSVSAVLSRQSQNAVPQQHTEETITLNEVGRTPEFDDPHDFDEWMFSGGDTFCRVRLMIGTEIAGSAVARHRDPVTGELYAVYSLQNGKWARTYVSRQVFEVARSKLGGSSPDNERSESRRPSSPASQFDSSHDRNRNPQSQSSLTVPPLPHHLQRQSGVMLEPVQMESGAESEIALFLLDDPDFTEQLARLDPFHLFARCGMANTSAGAIGFILWSVSSNGHVVDYEHLLNPFDERTIDLLASAGAQHRMIVTILDSYSSNVVKVIQFENNFKLDGMAVSLADVAKPMQPANFAATQEALRCEFSLDDLKSACW